MFEEALASCPRCGLEISFDVCNSVNADRRPDLRLEIMDGTFQRIHCVNCGATVAPPPLLTYLDLGRGQWILAKPSADFANWAALEAIAGETFAASFGPAAPPQARKLAEGLKRRIVFGWPALREKLLAAEFGIDDVALELLKLAVMRAVANQPFGDASELRLVAAADETLELRWLMLTTEDTIGGLSVERGVLNDIAVDRVAWEALRGRLTEGAFVDVTRLLT